MTDSELVERLHGLRSQVYALREEVSDRPTVDHLLDNANTWLLCAMAQLDPDVALATLARIQEGITEGGFT